MVHHVENSSSPEWVGTDQVRKYAFEEDRLLSSAGAGSMQANLLCACSLAARLTPAQPASAFAASFKILSSSRKWSIRSQTSGMSSRQTMIPKSRLPL